MSQCKHRIDLSGMYDDLERVGIDPKTSMDLNKPTSLFGGSDVEWGRWTYAYHLIPPPPPPDPAGLASDIIATVVTDVSGFAASYIAEKIGDLLSPPSLGDIIGLAGQQIGSYIIGAKELTEEILNTQESQSDNNEIETLLTNIGEIKDKVETQVSDVKDKVFGLVDQAAEWMQPLYTYITQGPHWVEAQANNVDSRAVEEIAHQIDIRFEKLRAEKRRFIAGLSEKWARRQAGMINETIYENLWDGIKRGEQLAQKAENIARGIAKDAICEMKALAGL